MTKLGKFVLRVAMICIGILALTTASIAIGFYTVFYFPNRTTATPGTVVSSGHVREYLLYVPPKLDRTRPAPLVISLHAAMSWPSSQMHFSQWNRVADQHGFIVVYPAGTGDGPKTWFMEGRRTPSRMPDVLFISDLIDLLEESYRIDPARVYVDGLSNGGGMAFALSCTLSGRIAAVGMVAAARSLDWTWCTDRRPVPSIAFHGTADPVAPFAGGRTPVGPDVFPGVLPFTAGWARRNQCRSGPTETVVASKVTRVLYTGCAGNADVILFTLTGAGHQWPGGERLPEILVGPYSRSIDATAEMWDFFRAHPLSHPEPLNGD